MLIAEQLLLIALDPQTGRIPLGTKDYLKVGLSGALLAELGIDEHLELTAGRVRVTTASVDPPADALLAEILAGLRTDEPMKPKAAVKRVDRLVGGSWNRLIDRLVEEQAPSDVNADPPSAPRATRWSTSKPTPPS